MKLIWTHHWPFSYHSNLGLRMGGVGGDVVNETLQKSICWEQVQLKKILGIIQYLNSIIHYFIIFFQNISCNIISTIFCPNYMNTLFLFLQQNVHSRIIIIIQSFGSSY